MSNSSLGFNVIQHRILAKSFDNILDACVELEGQRDPQRIMEVLGQAGAMAEEMVGSDGDMAEMAELFESEDGKMMLATLTAAGLAKLKMITWGCVDSVARLVEKDREYLDSVKRGYPERPLTREEMHAHFEKTVSGWLEEERPELVFAARAHTAKELLGRIRVDRFTTGNWWGVAMTLLDGPAS